MDRVVRKPAMPAIMVMIVASYVCLAILIALPVPNACIGETRLTLWHYLVSVALLGLIGLVTVYGRWKVLWMTPQILALAFMLIQLLTPHADPHAHKANDICFTSV